MRLLAVKILWVVFLAALFLMPAGLAAQNKPPTPPPAPAKPERSSEAPDLAELVLRANKLNNRLAVLETKISHGLDLNALEKRLEKVEARLEEYPSIIQELKAYPTLNYEKLSSLKDTLHLNAKNLAEIIDPVIEAVSKLATARKQWLAEKKRWQEWHSVLTADETLEEVKSTFTGAQNTINAALQSINQELKPLLELLKISGRVDTKINRFLAEIDFLISARRRAILSEETPPMFSLAYLSQLRRLTSLELERGMQAVSWPKPEFYRSQGWILVLQVLGALMVIFMVFRNRRRLRESKRWRFLAERPIAAGLLLGYSPFSRLCLCCHPLYIWSTSSWGGWQVYGCLAG